MPRDVTSKSSKKVWWRCEKGHEWKTAVNHRANGSGCPICSTGKQTSFPEQAIFYYIHLVYPDAKNGYTDPFNNHGMELDIYVPSLKVGIEYDGAAFHKTKSHYDRELRKYSTCKEQGVFLIRIRENRELTSMDSCDALLNVRVISISKNYPIKRIVLFGSRAEGTNREDSDVDLIMEFNTPVSLLVISQIRCDLEELLGLDVDIIHGPIRETDLIEPGKMVELYAA